MPDPIVQTLRELQESLGVAKRIYETACKVAQSTGSAEDITKEYRARRALEEAWSAWTEVAEPNLPYVLDLLAQREAALEEVTVTYRIRPCRSQELLFSRPQYVLKASCPHYVDWLRSRTKEEGAE